MRVFEPDTTTYEGIVDAIVTIIRQRRWLPPGPSTPWDGFGRLSELVHGSFVVPATSYTPVMRRLVFALACAKRPDLLVGVGTYVGYTLAWLVGNREDDTVGPLCRRAIAVDIDAEACDRARANVRALGHGEALEVRAADGVAVLGELNEPIDLLYLDLDSPTTGKAAYTDAILAARARLREGAVILAHDPVVARFERDIARYHGVLASDKAFEGPLVLPVDACGLSVSVFTGENTDHSSEGAAPWHN